MKYSSQPFVYWLYHSQPLIDIATNLKSTDNCCKQFSYLEWLLLCFRVLWLWYVLSCTFQNNWRRNTRNISGWNRKWMNLCPSFNLWALRFFQIETSGHAELFRKSFLRAYHSYLRVEWTELPCCNQNYSVRVCWPSRFEITLNHHLRCPNLSNFNGFRLQRGFCCCIDSDFLISEWAR